VSVTQAWRCPVRGHDEIRINRLSASDTTTCLIPAGDDVCGVKMQPIDAVSLSRYTIDKYGADAAKPSVLLARAVVDGAHERDRLRRRIARGLELAQEAVAIGQRWVGHDGPHDAGSDYRADRDRLAAITRYLESLRD
jgi:hypothetical protein